MGVAELYFFNWGCLSLSLQKITREKSVNRSLTLAFLARVCANITGSVLHILLIKGGGCTSNFG